MEIAALTPDHDGGRSRSFETLRRPRSRTVARECRRDRAGAGSGVSGPGRTPSAAAAAGGGADRFSRIQARGSRQARYRAGSAGSAGPRVHRAQGSVEERRRITLRFLRPNR